MDLKIWSKTFKIAEEQRNQVFNPTGAPLPKKPASGDEPPPGKKKPQTRLGRTKDSAVSQQQQHAQRSPAPEHSPLVRVV